MRRLYQQTMKSRCSLTVALETSVCSRVRSQTPLVSSQFLVMVQNLMRRRHLSAPLARPFLGSSLALVPSPLQHLGGQAVTPRSKSLRRELQTPWISTLDHRRKLRLLRWALRKHLNSTLLHLQQRMRKKIPRSSLILFQVMNL